MKTSHLILPILVSCVTLSACTQSNTSINTNSNNATQASQSSLSQSGTATQIQGNQISSSGSTILVPNR